MIEVGYESAPPTAAPQLASAADIELTRQSLHSVAIAAMCGINTSVPHIERRLGGDVVALCPLVEMLAEVLDVPAVSGALERALTAGTCAEIGRLRTAIADAYADQNAARMTTLWRMASVPYPQHCLQPYLCAGLSSCPRDPTCID